MKTKALINRAADLRFYLCMSIRFSHDMAHMSAKCLLISTNRILSPIINTVFQRTRDVENWTGVLNAAQLSPACPQSGADNSYIQAHLKGFERESENCLYLNIYVPKVSRTRGYKTSFMLKSSSTQCILLIDIKMQKIVGIL